MPVLSQTAKVAHDVLAIAYIGSIIFLPSTFYNDTSSLDLLRSKR